MLDVAVAFARGIARAVAILFHLSLLRSAVRTIVVAGGLALVALFADATCFLAVPHGFVGVKQTDVGDRGITEVLTYDEDFVREGFAALLR